MKYLLSGLIGVCCLLAGPAYAKDYTWEITTRMDMAGMPPGMGNQKSTSCIAEGKESEPDKSQCKVLDRSASGKITRMTVQCKEGTMKIEHEQISPERYRSKMQMTSGGDEMTVITEGRRLGSCDVTKDGSMSKETQAHLAQSAEQAKEVAEQLGKECQSAVDKWPGAAAPFTTYDSMVKGRQDFLAKAPKGPDGQRMADASYPPVPGCAQAKPEYCSKAKAAFSDMGTRNGYADVMRRAKPAKGVDAAVAYCSAGNATALRAGHCKASVSGGDYDFIAGYCPAERKVLAKQHCAGRAYTAIEAKYRAICGGGSGDDGSSSASSSGSAPAKDIQTEAVDQGVKAIKGLFNF